MPGRDRPELPVGFSWQESFVLKAAYPKPDGWFHKSQLLPGTVALFITREEIPPNAPNTPALKDIQAGRGFRTGLSVNALSGVRGKSGMRPTEYALRALKNPLLVPQGEIERFADDPFRTFRGEFRTGSAILERRGVGVSPTHLIMEATANVRTDRVYITWFETPEELWIQDQEVGRVMINARILDRST